MSARVQGTSWKPQKGSGESMRPRTGGHDMRPRREDMMGDVADSLGAVAGGQATGED